MTDPQIPMFFEDPPEEPPEPAYIGSSVARRSTSERAGTVLDPRWTHEIKATGRRKMVHGLYEEAKRLYQTGGERSNFVYWKKGIVTLAKDAWDQVQAKSDWIEIIDHEQNECWRIALGKARKNAVVYSAGIGDRVGIPIELWDVIDARGNYVRKGRTSG